nr:hypothetical protein [Tanacetum cinerariifolium]
MTNPEDITDPTTAMNMALALMAKAFKLNYSTPTNNNQRISSNPRNRQIAQSAGSESRPPMLNKENYVTWSSRHAKSRPNGKLIHNSIINCPYVRRMIPEPGDTNRELPVNETFHVQIDDELTEKELKQIKADDQAIQTILLGLPEDIYAVVDSCETAQEIWLRSEWSRHVTIVHQTKDLHTADYTQLYDFLKYNQKEVDELKAERLAKTQDPLELMANSNNPYAFPAPHQDKSSFNQNYMQQPMPNPEDITDPTTAMNMAFVLMAKAFKLNYSTPTINNQRISSNPCNRQIAQLGMNMGQDRQMQMVAQNPRVQNVGNQNGLTSVPGNGNQNGNGNLVVASEVHEYENCYDNEIFNMFTQEEQYSELLEPIPDQHQVKNTIVTLQRVVKHRMTLETHNWSSSAHQELHKIIKDENFPIVNQVDARVQNLEIQFLKEAAKFVRDFKSLAKEGDESLAKHKTLELEIERLLRAVVSQDIMSVVQKTSVVDTSNL